MADGSVRRVPNFVLYLTAGPDCDPAVFFDFIGNTKLFDIWSEVGGSLVRSWQCTAVIDPNATHLLMNRPLKKLLAKSGDVSVLNPMCDM